MKEVKTSMISSSDNINGRSIKLIMNIDVVQGDDIDSIIPEPNTYFVLVEFFFLHNDICLYTNSQRILVDAWSSLRDVYIEKFIDDMFFRLRQDVATKEEVMKLVNRKFKYDSTDCTPLMLAAQEGELHTVH